MSGPTLVTAKRLMRMPDDGFRYELDGQDVVPGFRCHVAELFMNL